MNLNGEDIHSAPYERIKYHDSIVKPGTLKDPLPDTGLLIPFQNFFLTFKRCLSIPHKNFPFIPGVKYGIYDKKLLISGPFLGAPAAVMLFESLASSGVKKFILLGVCGSISESLKIGDFFIPVGGISDEGTSKAYLPQTSPYTPSPAMLGRIRQVLKNNDILFKSGNVWTTDSPFRETAERIKIFKDQGALAVEMEFTALAAVANFFEIDFGALFIVSDECFGSKWKKGFGSLNNKFCEIANIFANFDNAHKEHCV